MKMKRLKLLPYSYISKETYTLAFIGRADSICGELMKLYTTIFVQMQL